MNSEKSMEQETREHLIATLPDILLPWYVTNARDLPWRRDREPYHVWLSEIMLQQTRVEAARDYFTRFLQTLPDIAALAQAPEQQLYKLWEGLGYYSRVRNLQKAAQIIEQELGGVFPTDYAAINALPGIGTYTAGAISSICFGQPYAAVDGNVLRILARITADASPIDTAATKAKAKTDLERIYPRESCGAFTQALMELGATVCTPRAPRCADCPMAALCMARQAGSVDQLPVKSPKAPKRQETRTVFLLECDARLALIRRPKTGLLADLWQLPDVAETLDMQQVLEQAHAWGVEPVELQSVVKRAHIFTHIRWEMTCYTIRCAVPDARFTWCTRVELNEKFPLPTAYRQFLTT